MSWGGEGGTCPVYKYFISCDMIFDSRMAGSLMQQVQLVVDAPRCGARRGNIWQTIYQLSVCSLDRAWLGDKRVL